MRRRLLWLAVLLLAPALPAAPADAAVTTLSVTAAADTYVAANSAGKSFGRAKYLAVDASPATQSFVRFNVTGVAGRLVTDVRLRLYQVDASATGGRVFSLSNNAWTETVTWNTRPAVDGPLLAEFGRVEANRWYEVSLGRALAGDGPVSFALDSPSSDAAQWASRETSNRPQLVVEVADVAADDAVQPVAGVLEGSSDPTFFASQHRLAETRNGRLLAVHGRHASGLQLAWRDVNGSWSRATRGHVLDGQLLGGTGSGDWPASVAVGTGADGAEHAWVVWAGTNGFGETPRPVEMRRLSDLDSLDGPMVGPVVRVAEPGVAGNGRVDVGFERLASGGVRGWLSWASRTDSATTAADHLVQSFTGIESDTPVLNPPTNLFWAGSVRVATLAPTADAGGMRLLMRSAGGRMRLYRHDPAVASGGWTAGAEGVALAGGSRPAAAALPGGSVLSVVESDVVNDVVSVQRFSAAGAPEPAELVLSGYREPTVSVLADGSAFVVAVRASDGLVVSRRMTPGTTEWSGEDRVELGPEAGGNHQWPNALRQGGRHLRFVVRGPSGGSNRSAVLSVVRTP